MYIDPNTGGVLFQALAALAAVCGPLLVGVGGIVGTILYFVIKGNKNRPDAPKRDGTS